VAKTLCKYECLAYAKRVQGGNINGSDAHPASTVNKITWPCYVTLDSLISSPILVGWASDPFMLPPYTAPEPTIAFFGRQSDLCHS
jgi:hypothetical protein